MALYESYVKMINARLKEVYNYFSPTSSEYQNMASSVFNIMGQDSVLLSIQNGKPMRLIRSKKANEENPLLYQDMQDIWRYISSQGTVRTLVKKRVSELKDSEISSIYDSIIANNNENDEPVSVDDMKRVTIKNWKSKEVKEGIQSNAKEEYKRRYDDTDIYESIHELLSKESEKEVFDSVFYGKLDEVSRIFHQKGNRDIKYNEIVAKWESINQEYENKIDEMLKNDSRDEYDMGENP